MTMAGPCLLQDRIARSGSFLCRMGARQADDGQGDGNVAKGRWRRTRRSITVPTGVLSLR